MRDKASRLADQYASLASKHLAPPKLKCQTTPRIRFRAKEYSSLHRSVLQRGGWRRQSCGSRGVRSLRHYAVQWAGRWTLSRISSPFVGISPAGHSNDFQPDYALGELLGLFSAWNCLIHVGSFGSGGNVQKSGTSSVNLTLLLREPALHRPRRVIQQSRPPRLSDNHRTNDLAINTQSYAPSCSPSVNRALWEMARDAATSEGCGK